ncbi:12-oxophytodienoate reductase [Phycisphaerales bacterium ac7]
MTKLPTADQDLSPEAAAERVAPLFERADLAGIELCNRIAMAPMTRRLSPDDRVPSQAVVDYYARRAAGGVGLIITEGTHVDDKHAPDSANVPGIFNDEQASGWKRVIDAVHSAENSFGSPSRIAVQLWHTGRHAMNPIGPSAIPVQKRDGGYKDTPREMTEADMDEVVAIFENAARLSIEAGFDSMEIHGAHGYLLDSFLSPASNQRTDDYGGSFENRMRFPLRVVRAVRKVIDDHAGPDYPLMIRFSQWRMEDYSAYAYPDPDHLERWVLALKDAGVDILHVSTRDATDPGFPHLFDTDTEDGRRTLAGWTRKLSGGMPTVAVGRVSVSASMDEGAAVQTTDPAPAAELISRGEADMIAVGRSLIANPRWCDTVREGRWNELVPYTREMLESLDD